MVDPPHVPLPPPPPPHTQQSQEYRVQLPNAPLVEPIRDHTDIGGRYRQLSVARDLAFVECSWLHAGVPAVHDSPEGPLGNHLLPLDLEVCCEWWLTGC